MAILDKFSDAVLTAQQCSNGTWAVTVVSGEGQTRANLSVSYFDTEAEARTGAILIGAAYAISPNFSHIRGESLIEGHTPSIGRRGRGRAWQDANMGRKDGAGLYAPVAVTPVKDQVFSNLDSLIGRVEKSANSFESDRRRMVDSGAGDYGAEQSEQYRNAAFAQLNILKELRSKLQSVFSLGD